MATTTKQWENGGSLTATYEGSSDGSAVFTSDVNESIDREMDVTFVDESRTVEVVRTVRQIGMREPFAVTEGDFILSDGGTFNVLKGLLPSGYKALDYIEFDGSQHIDTGFFPNQDSGIVMDFEATSLSATGWLCCGRTAANNSAFGLYYYRTSGVLYFVYGKNQSKLSTATATKRQTATIDKNVCSVDGDSITIAAQTFRSSAPLTLFARNTDGDLASYGIGKLYSCKVYDNDTLILDYLPCEDSNGVQGLLDLITYQFYPLLSN